MKEGKEKKKVVTLRWSIGTKLTVLILAMAIIPLSTIAYYNLTQSRDEVAKVAMENLEEISCGTSYGHGICANSIGQHHTTKPIF